MAWSLSILSMRQEEFYKSDRWVPHFHPFVSVLNRFWMCDEDNKLQISIRNVSRPFLEALRLPVIGSWINWMHKCPLKTSLSHPWVHDTSGETTCGKPGNQSLRKLLPNQMIKVNWTVARSACQKPNFCTLRSFCEASQNAKKVGHHHNWTMLITIWLYDYVHSFSPGVDHSGHPLPSTGIKNQQEPRQKNFQAVMNIVCSAKHCVLCPHAILCSECACCWSLCLPSSTKISVFDWVWFCYIKSMSTMHRHTILMLSLDLERS